MNWTPARLMALVSISLLLTACEPSGKGEFRLTDLPQDIRTCFDEMTPRPPDGALSQKQVAALIAKLRASEMAKTGCGRRALALYDAQAAVLAGQAVP